MVLKKTKLAKGESIITDPYKTPKPLRKIKEIFSDLKKSKTVK